MCSTGSVRRWIPAPGMLAAEERVGVQARIASRALLVLLLMLAVGTAETMETRFRSHPTPKTRRGSSQQAAAKRKLRCFRAEADCGQRELVDSGVPGSVPGRDPETARLFHPGLPALTPSPEVHLDTRMWSMWGHLARVETRNTIRFPDLPNPPPHNR